MAAAAFLASMLLVGGVLSLGAAPSSASPAPQVLSQAPLPIVRPLEPRPSTETLAVAQPAQPTKPAPPARRRAHGSRRR
jgi:hypothetical protein